MAINKKIIDLTALALSDRVLTITERKTIVSAALNDGIPEAEINAYLDNALRERLKNFSKEDLKRCPHCGAQIPLISDDCLFCGESLKSGVATGEKSVKISGIEADVIRQENLRTAQEQQNIKNCPDCGAPFPLISNICGSCGHVLHAQKDSAANISNLLSGIKGSLQNLENTPKPTLGQVFKQNKHFISMFWAVYFFLMWMSYSDSGTDYNYLYCGLQTILFALTMFWTYKIKVGTSPVDIADNQFFAAINNYEMYLRQTDTLYGENPEARALLKKYSSEIDNYQKIRRKNRLIIALGIAIPVLLAAYQISQIPTSIERKRQQTEQLQQSTMQQIPDVKTYKSAIL